MKKILPLLAICFCFPALASSTFIIHNESNDVLKYTPQTKYTPFVDTDFIQSKSTQAFNFRDEPDQDNGISFESVKDEKFNLLLNFHCSSGNDWMNCDHDFTSRLVGPHVAFNWSYSSDHKDIEMWICSSQQFFELGHCPGVPVNTVDINSFSK